MSWVVATDCSANNDGNNVQQELRMVAGQRTVSTAWSASYGAFFEGDGSAEDVWHHRGQNHSQLKDLGAPEALLQKVWTQPGAMHSKFRVGTIAVNAMANLTIWDTEHPSFWPPSAPMRTLAMADPIGAIHGMVVGGRIQGTWGDFHRSLWTSDAYIEARTEANERLRHLLRS